MQDNKIPGAEQLKVLLVEDNLFAQRLAVSTLKQLGIVNLTATKDGAAAIEILDHSKITFDLIISDWNMPHVSGLDLLKHVRKTWENMPFLMLTGNANEDFVIMARKHKVDAYIIKPFSASQLQQKISALFNIRIT